MGHGTLLVIGSGPGIGSNVAKVFAERGFKKVILSSRNSERLTKEVDEVKAAASTADVVSTTIDLSDKRSVNAALGEIEKLMQDGPALEAVLFNAARIGPSEMFTFTAEEMERDLQVCPPSAFHKLLAAFNRTRCGSLTRTPTDLRNIPLHNRQLGSAEACRDGQGSRGETESAGHQWRAGERSIPACLLPGHV